MNIEEIITLDNDREYLLLLDVLSDNKKYFLACEFEKNSPTKKYAILEEFFENNDYYVEEVEDNDLRKKLIVLFEKRFDEQNA